MNQLLTSKYSDCLVKFLHYQRVLIDTELDGNVLKFFILRPYNNPSNEFGYTENFLFMLDRLSEANYKPNPRLAHALDVIFILHADHELNCSTAALRQMASTGVDPFICLATAASALYGPSQ